MKQLSFNMKINNELKLEDILTLLKEKVNSMELDEKVDAINSIKEAFQNHEFSKSWEEFESKYYD